MPDAGMSKAGTSNSDGHGPGRGDRPAVTLRTMTSADVEAGLRLCRLSHWNQVGRDWQQFLECSPDGAAVAVADDGRVVGSVATMRYVAVVPPASQARVPADRPALAWIAMVLVDPAARGRGIGAALLERGMALVADVPTQGLDATPLGQPLYEKLGFRTDSTLTRMERPAGASFAASACTTEGSQAGLVRRLEAGDLEAVAALDARATGLDRTAMLSWLREGAPGFGWVSTDRHGIDGFVLGRRGHAFSHVGPIIASSPDVAARLVTTCAGHHADSRLIVDIADARPGWRAAIEALGFTPQRPFARMYRGEWRPAGDASLLYASIGPEFG